MIVNGALPSGETSPGGAIAGAQVGVVTSKATSSMYIPSAPTDGEFDVTLPVGHGDVVLCPYGYHGPSVAVPGHHMYFLNVMAGPGAERIWQASDDPAQTWIRDTWLELETDPRLPMTSHRR